MIVLLNIDDLRRLCQDKSIAITKHARNRLAERGITIGDVQNAIRTGEIIKQYENDKPFPSCLLLGQTEQNKYIHVVASIDDKVLYVITAYYPDEDEWKADLKTRKEQQL
jgi:DNA-directed RNA polymerase beta' subunit